MIVELQTLFLEFFKNLGIEIESFSVKEEDGKNIYRAVLQSPDSKLLIGIHGKTLEALSHIMTRISEKKYQQKMLVRLEVNDYLQSKEDRLHQYINKKILESQEKGERVPLSNLTPYERKLVHSYIQDLQTPWIQAQSEWEGIQRTLYLNCTKLSPTKSDLSEDGIWI